MSIVFDILYAIAFVFAVPLLLIKSWRTGKYRGGWGQRFGRYPKRGAPAAGRKRLMIHCVSVGELLSVRALVDKLLSEGDIDLIITTTTDTGTARAKEVFGAEKYRGRVETCRYPLDFSWAVRGFLRHARPDAVALVELETWPNFIRIAGQRGIPVVIINGRLTARSLRRYRIVACLIKPMMRRLTWLGIQTQTIADRFGKLGARPERVEVIPTLKYDTADLSDAIPGAAQLAAACGIAAGHQLLVGGSTGPGEEAFLLETYQALRGKYPNLRLAIAARKPETNPQVLAAIKAAGLNAVLRTERPDSATGAELGNADVLVLNTMGELKKLYSLSAASFVGRSLVPLGGSDMIEVAALAKACCFGPHTFNFAEAVELLTHAKAAVELSDAGELTKVVEGWLADPGAAAAIGKKARAVIAAQRGSTARYAEKLRGVLGRVAVEAVV